MRDLDKRAFLVNDFIIVYGDIVATLSLTDALAAHRARKQKDRNAIMTMVLRESGRSHRTKPQGVTPAFLLDARTHRCLQYEQLRSTDETHLINIDEELLQNHELDIRTDLIDAGIDICTPDALALWSDNFDFQTPRKNYLHQVLKDYELNGKTFFAHIVSDQYAARVRSLNAYVAVSKDMVNRWAYPLCPDSNIGRDQNYRMYSGKIYKEQDVILARSCIVGSGTVIGKGCSIGDGTIVSGSVIGRHCIIGKNVVIENSHIWDDTSIGDGTIIRNAIVAAEVSVGRRCKLEPGVVVSYGVAIADGITLKSGQRITRMKRQSPTSGTYVRGDADANVVGKGGDGFIYVDSDDDEDEPVEAEFAPGSCKFALKLSIVMQTVQTETNGYKVYLHPEAAVSTESISTLNSEDSDEQIYTMRPTSASFTSVASDDSAAHISAGFTQEVVATIVDAIAQNQDPGNVQIELQNLKITNNASEDAVRKAVVLGFSKKLAQLNSSTGSAKAAVDGILPRYKLLMQRLMSDKEASTKSDQVSFLLLFQHECVHIPEGGSLLLHLCTAFSRDDVIQTEGFEQWWQDEKTTATEEMTMVRAKTTQLIDFLLEESEEESDDEEEDEDSE